MDKVTPEQLKNIIDLHAKFLKGTGGGQRAILKYKDLSGLDFRLADLTNADFSACCLNGANLSQATFVSACFFACDMEKADLSASNFTRADFRGANIIGSNLTEANFTHADFRQGYLLNYADDDPNAGWGQSGTTELAGSTIRDTDLTGALAQHSNFSDANLTGVTMLNVDLRGADLSGANLTDTNLTGAQMARTKTEKAIVNGTKLDSVTGNISALKKLQKEQESRKKLDHKSKNRNISVMVKNHSLWVASAGDNGEQLNLSGYDLSREANIGEYPLSIIIAKDCKFTGLDLEGVSMQSSVLDESDFQDIAAHGADFRGSSFVNAKFTRADLSNADFSILTVEKKGDQPVNLSGAKLAFTNLEGTNFKGANLSGADFTRADMRGADLTDCNLDGAIFEKVDMSQVTMSDTVVATKDETGKSD
ncbi:MAG: pentapeptide repeat-containing protein [Pseudomonadota bacterium]